MEPLEALLQVQEHDTAVDRLELRRRELPARAELAGLEARIGQARAELADLDARRAQLARRQGDLEAEIAAALDRVHSLERRMYGGQVSAPKDLAAMSEEVSMLNRRRAELEDRVVQIMEEAEPLEAEVAQRSEALARLEQEAEGLRGQLAAQEADLDAEIAAERQAKAARAAQVGPELLGRYERIRSRLGGVGVARLVGSSCGGCHLALPAAEVERLRHARAGAVLTCDQCGRIIVP
jgi:predicted  nucleic acid-binding Zn-ribbon protein